MAVRNIELRGVRVHNLKNIDLDLPHRQLIVVCGVSGSGKTSLALDTLYAEGQRRYIESFSAYTRQFLDQFEKPAADRIDGLPPAIAVTRAPTSRSSRSTVATATEMADYLRLLFAKIGQIHCHQCRRSVRADTPQTVTDQFAGLSDGRRLMVAFRRTLSDPQEMRTWAAELAEDGFVRAVIAGQTVPLGAGDDAASAPSGPSRAVEALVVVDRLVAGQSRRERIHDSVETAFAKGHGRCVMLVEVTSPSVAPDTSAPPDASVAHQTIDGRLWEVWPFGESLRCESCGIDYLPLEPRSLSFNSPLGACPACEGFGNILDIDMDLVVPDAGKSLARRCYCTLELARLRATSWRNCWRWPTTTAFPPIGRFAICRTSNVELIRSGVPEREFGGLRGFFQWLERRKYKMHLRVFLSRWRSYRTCPACQGDRLRPEALAVELGGQNLGQVSRMEIREARAFFQQLSLTPRQRTDRPHDAATDRCAAGVSRSRRAGIPDSGSDHSHAQRGRSTTRGADLCLGIEPGEHAVRAR